MVDVNALADGELRGLSPEASASLLQQLLQQVKQQRQDLQQRDEHIERQARAIASKDAEIQFKSAKLEKITFELARLKAWKFGAKTEAMSA